MAAPAVAFVAITTVMGATTRSAVIAIATAAPPHLPQYFSACRQLAVATVDFEVVAAAVVAAEAMEVGNLA